jgi:hypothetical protein
MHSALALAVSLPFLVAGQLPSCTVGELLGCFEDQGSHGHPEQRTLSDHIADIHHKITQEECAALCDEKGFKDDAFKGIEYGHQCFCGTYRAAG